MRTFNTPAQARSLREIEAATVAPATEQIKDVYGEIQPVSAEEPQTIEETRAQTETEESSKKSRTKKNTKAI